MFAQLFRCSVFCPVITPASQPVSQSSQAKQRYTPSQTNKNINWGYQVSKSDRCLSQSFRVQSLVILRSTEYFQYRSNSASQNKDPPANYISKTTHRSPPRSVFRRLPSMSSISSSFGSHSRLATAFRTKLASHSHLEITDAILKFSSEF